MSTEPQYFKINRETIDGKEKWVLSHRQSQSYQRIYAFAHLRSAKARIVKMSGSNPYHFSVEDGVELLENEAFNPSAIPSDLSETDKTLYQRVVYSIDKILDSYSVVCVKYFSAKKDFSTAESNSFLVGEYPSYSQAFSAMQKHAVGLPAYRFYRCYYKPGETCKTVLENELVSKSDNHDAEGWFEETVVPSETATLGDGIDGTTVSPPSNTGGLKSNEEKRGATAFNS